MTVESLLDSKPVWALGGALVSLTLAYFSFTKDILKELGLLKGQNILIFDKLRVVEKLQEKTAFLKEGLDRARYDVDAAHEKLRELKKDSANSHSRS